MKNEMNMVSFILETELNTPFRLDRYQGLYRLTETNGIEKMVKGERWVAGDKAVLVEILLGKTEILQPALTPSEKKIIRDYVEKSQIKDKIENFTVSYSGRQPDMIYHLKAQWRANSDEKPEGDIVSYYRRKDDQNFFIGEITRYPEGKMFQGLNRSFEYKLEELRLWEDDL